MTAPSFVNNTGIQGSAFAGDPTQPTLPGSRTNGNLLLAWMQTGSPDAVPTLNFDYGTLTGNLSAASFTPTLPSGHASGDLLISFCQVAATGKTIAVSG